MRVRAGENDVSKGNVVPRLYKCVHAIALIIGTTRKLRGRHSAASLHAEAVF
jgi:hypothetical protein